MFYHNILSGMLNKIPLFKQKYHNFLLVTVFFWQSYLIFQQKFFSLLSDSYLENNDCTLNV